MNKIVFIYARSFKPSGVSIIISHLKDIYEKNNIKVETITTLKGINKNSFIIPYGLLESFDLIKINYKCEISLMIDAISLGAISEFLFFIGKKGIPFSFKIKKLIQFFYYFFLEFIVLIKYKDIVLVSHYDKKYFKKIFILKKLNEKIIILPNGVDIPSNENIVNYKKKNYKTIKLGIISYWSKTAFYNVNWFIIKYFKLLKKKHPNMYLIICGKGASNEMIRYWDEINGINYIGEVDDLANFFNQIDISLITLPKKCGILNKILDSFAYKKIVLGMQRNFYAFPYLKNAYYEFSDYNSICNSIDMIINDKFETDLKIINAFEYIKKYHSWSEIYQKFYDKYLYKIN